MESAINELIASSKTGIDVVLLNICITFWKSIEGLFLILILLVLWLKKHKDTNNKKNNLFLHSQFWYPFIKNCSPEGFRHQSTTPNKKIQLPPLPAAEFSISCKKVERLRYCHYPLGFWLKGVTLMNVIVFFFLSSCWYQILSNHTQASATPFIL